MADFALIAQHHEGSRKTYAIRKSNPTHRAGDYPSPGLKIPPE
jgi:hypothetical protein